MINIAEDKAIKITYGVLGTGLALIFGFAAWMTTVKLQADQLEVKVNKIENYLEKVDEGQGQIKDSVISIDKRTTRIEVLLENLTKGE